jgi:hypothetical protein
VRTVVDASGRAPQSPPQGLNLQQNFRNQWNHVDPAIMNQVRGRVGVSVCVWVGGGGGGGGGGTQARGGF